MNKKIIINLLLKIGYEKLNEDLIYQDGINFKDKEYYFYEYFIFLIEDNFLKILYEIEDGDYKFRNKKYRESWLSGYIDNDYLKNEIVERIEFVHKTELRKSKIKLALGNV